MPERHEYKEGSVIFFKGNRATHLFFLESGRVQMVYQDPVTTSPKVLDVRSNEFFGVHAAMGFYPHEETATAISPAIMIKYTPAEFEQFLYQNPQKLHELLIDYSSQLRQTHRTVQSMLAQEVVVDCEDGLYSIAKYYVESRQFENANYIFNRYKELYPNGTYLAQLAGFAEQIKMRVKTSFKPGSPSPSTSSAPKEKPTHTFSQAEHLFNEGKYPAALHVYSEIASSGSPSKVEAEFKAGVCLFKMHKHPKVLQFFTSYVKRYPKTEKLGEILYYLGMSTRQAGNVEKGSAFLKKSLELLEPESKMAYMAKKTLEGN